MLAGGTEPPASAGPFDLQGRRLVLVHREQTGGWSPGMATVVSQVGLGH